MCILCCKKFSCVIVLTEELSHLGSHILTFSSEIERNTHAILYCIYVRSSIQIEYQVGEL